MRREHREALLQAAMKALKGGNVDWTAVNEQLPDQPGLIRNLQAITSLASRESRKGDLGEPGDPRDSGDPGDRGDPGDPGSERSVLFVWGHLQVTGTLGEGSYGTIYRAFDTRLHREVALKLMKRSADSERTVQELLAEGRRLARIRHPNVVTIHGADVHDDAVGIWFDLLAGSTLEELLQSHGPFDEGEIASIGLQLAGAVKAVHEAGVVHGDIKTANVIRESGGRPILFDFGSGRAHTESPLFTGKPTGTPLVLPPEFFLGGQIDSMADIYSLGVLLFRLASALYPVSAETLDDLADRHHGGERRNLAEERPDLHPQLIEVIGRALESDRTRRYSTAAEFEEALAECRTRILREKEALAAPPADAPQTGNLPRSRSRFIGRRRELDRTEELLAQHRLVTLTGAGGCGKTRLAVEAGWKLQRQFPHGVWMVELAAVTEPENLPQTVADLFQIKDDGRHPVIEKIAAFLGERHVLLILDNCEHLLDSCRQLVEGILRFPGPSRILATSREALAVEGEVVSPVTVLSNPDSDRVSATQALRFEAVELLVERMRALDSSFALTEANTESVVQICRRLDGIPLALELAAARIRVLTVDQIAKRLEDRFRLLTGGAAEALPRHRTLRALIDWSHEQLSEDEQTLLRRLSVFAGGWTIEEMEAVCADPEPATRTSRTAPTSGLEALDPPDLQDPLNLLTSLRHKSLVEEASMSRSQHGTARLQMLETIRAYAAEKLAQSGEESVVRLRHAHRFLSLAAEAEPRLKGGNAAAVVAALASEQENLHTALATFLASEDLESAVSLAADLGLYWWMRGHWGEAARVYAELIRRGPIRSAAYAKALLWSGHVAGNRGDFDRARREMEEAYALSVDLGDPRLSAQALSYRGSLAYGQSDYAEAERLLTESLAFHRKSGDERSAALVLCSLGNTAQMIGDLSRAQACYEECLPLLRRLNDPTNVAYSLQRLADIVLSLGDPDRSSELLKESLDLRLELKEPWGVAATRIGLADIAMARERWSEARPHLVEALRTFRELGDASTTLRTLCRLGQVDMREGRSEEARAMFDEAMAIARQIASLRDRATLLLAYADLALSLDDPQLAARLYGAGEAQFRSLGIELGPDETIQIERARKEIAEKLGEELGDRFWQEGAALSEEEVDRLLGVRGERL